MNLKEHRNEKDIEIITLPDNKLQIFLPPAIIGPLDNYLIPRTPNLSIKINNLHEPDRANFSFSSKLEYLGSGGFSKVYRYRGDLNNKAVKKIVADPKYYSKVLTAEDSIKREIYGMSKINCSNSLKVYAVYQNVSKDNFYILMELCDGNIDDYIKTRGYPLNIYEIIILLFQLNKAFYLLDKKNIIHRDIKPSNILYKEDKDIDPHNKRINKKLFGGKKYVFKLGDYGVCLPLYDQKYSKSQFMGTLDFMAPEIYNMKCEKEHPVFTKKIDLFSLGQSILCLMGFIEKASTLTAIMVEELKKSCSLFNGNRKEKLLADLIFNYLLIFDVEKRAGWKEYFNHPIFGDDLLYKKYENKNKNSKEENVLYKKNENKNKNPKEENGVRIEKRLIKRNSMDNNNKETQNKIKNSGIDFSQNNENKNNNIWNNNIIIKYNSNINKRYDIINTNKNNLSKSFYNINKCNSIIDKNSNQKVNNINKNIKNNNSNKNNNSISDVNKIYYKISENIHINNNSKNNTHKSEQNKNKIKSKIKKMEKNMNESNNQKEKINNKDFLNKNNKEKNIIFIKEKNKSEKFQENNLLNKNSKKGITTKKIRECKAPKDEEHKYTHLETKNNLEKISNNYNLNKNKMFNINLSFENNDYQIKKKLTCFIPKIKPLISNNACKNEDNIIKNYQTHFFINEKKDKIKNIFIKNSHNQINNNLSYKDSININLLNKRSAKNIFNEKNKYNKIIIINDKNFNKNKINFSFYDNNFCDKNSSTHSRSFFSVRNKYKKLNNKDITMNNTEVDLNKKKNDKVKNKPFKIAKNLSPQNSHLLENNKDTYNNADYNNKITIFSNNNNSSPKYKTSKRSIKYNSRFNKKNIISTEVYDEKLSYNRYKINNFCEQNSDKTKKNETQIYKNNIIEDIFNDKNNDNNGIYFSKYSKVSNN